MPRKKQAATSARSNSSDSSPADVPRTARATAAAVKRRYVPVCVRDGSPPSRPPRSRPSRAGSQPLARSTRATTVVHQYFCNGAPMGSAPSATPAHTLPSAPKAPPPNATLPGAQAPPPNASDTEQLRALRQRPTAYRTDFPVGPNSAANFEQHIVHFVIGAARLMDDPECQREFPDVRRRLKFISELLFAGAYKKYRAAHHVVLDLYAWKLLQ